MVDWRLEASLSDETEPCPVCDTPSRIGVIIDQKIWHCPTCGGIVFLNPPQEAQA